MNKLILNLIQEELEKLLDEDAVDLSQIQSQHLALAILFGDNNIKFVLYSPEKLKQYFKTTYKNIVMKGASRNFKTDYDIVFGVINIQDRRNDCDTWFVDYSAAQKGYGPFMYDAAMSFIYPDYLSSDKRTVSQPARKVWQYMAKNRKNDFKIKQVPDEQGCGYADEDGEGKEDVLDYAFSINSRINYSTIVGNHKRAEREITSAFRSYVEQDEVEEELAKIANTFFSQRYGG